LEQQVANEIHAPPLIPASTERAEAGAQPLQTSFQFGGLKIAHRNAVTAIEADMLSVECCLAWQNGGLKRHKTVAEAGALGMIFEQS
jgi:hypothetical protein